MKPPAPREPTVPIAVRAPEAIVERLDALAAAMSTPWHQATRSEAARAAIERGLGPIEAEIAAKRK